MPSTGVHLAIARLMGDQPEDRRRSRLPSAARPVAVKIHDPLGDVEDLLRVAEGVGGQRPPSRYLQSRRSGNRVGRRASGLVTLDHRVCCVQHLSGVNRRLHLLRLPHRTTCPECETVFQVEMGVSDYGV